MRKIVTIGQKKDEDWVSLKICHGLKELEVTLNEDEAKAVKQALIMTENIFGRFEIEILGGGD